MKPLFILSMLLGLMTTSLTGCFSDDGMKGGEVKRRNEEKYVTQCRLEYAQFLSVVSGDIDNAICSNGICAYRGKSYNVGHKNSDDFVNQRADLILRVKERFNEKYKRQTCLEIAKSGNDKMYRKYDCEIL